MLDYTFNFQSQNLTYVSHNFHTEHFLSFGALKLHWDRSVAFELEGWATSLQVSRPSAHFAVFGLATKEIEGGVSVRGDS